jgi:hypothetical protein
LDGVAIGFPVNFSRIRFKDTSLNSATINIHAEPSVYTDKPGNSPTPIRIVPTAMIEKAIHFTIKETSRALFRSIVYS